MKLIRIGCNHNSTCTKLENLDDIFNQGQKIAFFCQLGFSSKIKVPQLGSSRKIPARTHLYKVALRLHYNYHC